MTPRTVRTIIAATASVAILITAPGLVGIAAARDKGGNDNVAAVATGTATATATATPTATPTVAATATPTATPTLAAAATATPTATPRPGRGHGHGHDGEDGDHHGNQFGLQNVSPELAMAIKDARTTYRLAVAKAKLDFRISLQTVRTAIQTATAPQLADVRAKKQAYLAAVVAGADLATQDAAKLAFVTSLQAYRTAWVAAKATHQAEIDAAMAKAKADIAAAGTAYTAAVNAAFAKLLPGTTVPAGLLNPPGRDGNKGHGSLGWLKLKSVSHS